MFRFAVRNIAYRARKPHAMIHRHGTLSATKSKFCGLRESLLFLSMCARSSSLLSSFPPFADVSHVLLHRLTIHNKKRPLLWRALALMYVCYIVLFFAFGVFAFGVFSLIEKLAFGDICGFISKSVYVQIVNVGLLADCVLTDAVFIIRGK